MEKIETLLKKDLSSTFDTPKKLNRSSRAINQTVIDELESGVFTCEAIDSLAMHYPIFKYRTCITVHGAWPEISRTRIGGYKNVHQNQNGSVEVRYSAIDVQKVHKIAQTLRACDSKFRYQENSNERGFYWMHEIRSKEDILKASEVMKPFAEKLTALKIYGHVSLFTARDFFRQYLVLALVPLALPAAMVETVESELTELTTEQIAIKIAEYNQAQERENQERRARMQAYEVEKKAKENEILARAELLKPQIAHLSECNDITRGILVKIFHERASDKVRFVYYRKTGTGSFGRVRWAKAFSDFYTTDIDALQWIEQKQQKVSDFKIKFFRLVTQGAQTKTAA